MKISKDINENLKHIQNIFNYDTNSDFIIRKFNVVFDNRNYSSFLCFFNGMSKNEFITDNILSPLMREDDTNLAKTLNLSLNEYIEKNAMSMQVLNVFDKYSKLTPSVCAGNVAVFVDTLDVCYVCDTSAMEHRPVDKPYYESSIKGPQESFNETLNTNRALIRKNVQDSNLVIEGMDIGNRAKNKAILIYVKGLTNEHLIKDLKNRISSIDTDIIIAADTLEQYIENSTYSPMPQFLSTERPDRVASFLMQGRIAIMTNNCPTALIAPTTIVDWFHSVEDAYIKAPFNYIMKFIRLLGIFVALFLPALYIATVTYHIDIFPTNLVLTLTGTRELVPLPFIVEMLIMELAFELLREAEMRVPSKIGPIISIVGGLILRTACSFC